MEGRRLGSPGGEHMPWLDPVEEEAPPATTRVSGRLILFAVAGLVLLVAGLSIWSWAGSVGATEGQGALIRAPEGDYKVPPPERGGMEVEGKGDSAFATSEGAEPKARIDISAVPEQPIVAREPRAAARRPSGTEATTIQIGAFSSQSAANAAWKSLAERFAYLQPLAHSVIPVESEERVLYRLRASGPGAAAICGRLRVAGESCIAVQ